MTRDVKLIVSIALSVLAIILCIAVRSKERRNTMFAMIICTIGDAFMMDCLDIGDNSLYIGAGCFMLAHLIYSFSFINSGRRKGYKYFNGGFAVGVTITLFMTGALAYLAFTVPDEPEETMFYLLLVYIAFIAFNMVSQYSYATNEGGARVFLFLAMLLFMVSDYTIFLDMLNIEEAHNDFVWATYIPAQFLIVMFNSSFRRDSNNDLARSDGLQGEGTDYELRKAISEFAKAAEEGDAEAQCLMGYCFREGIEVRKDNNAAFQLFKNSALQGFPMAIYNLGYCYEHGIGVARDSAVAAKYYNKAKELGYTE